MNPARRRIGDSAPAPASDERDNQAASDPTTAASPSNNGEHAPTAAQELAIVLNLATTFRLARGGKVQPKSLARAMDSPIGDLIAALSDMPSLHTREAFPAMWVRLHAHRLAADPDEILQAYARAEQLAAENLDEPRGPDDTDKPYVFSAIDALAFLNRRYERAWFVEKVMVKDRACLLGGPKKCLKTSILIDLAISIAVERKFLGQFYIPKHARVLLISGESGEAVIQETMRRVCAAKDIAPEKLAGRLYLEFRLPSLNDGAQMESLASFIRENGIELVIIDPLYLALLTGSNGKRLDPANIFDIGPLLSNITETCSRAGATIILAHHTRKHRECPFEPPELEDLAFAGIQEFARQWILIGRRAAYVPGSGRHELWLTAGGSDGHGGAWGLDIAEGVTSDDFATDRQWQVDVKPASEVKQSAKEQKDAANAESAQAKETAKEAAKDRRLADGVAKIVDHLKHRPGQSATAREIKDLCGWNNERYGAVIARCLDRGYLAETTIKKSSGKSVTLRDFPALRLVPGTEVYPCNAY
jgi:replicative DNA helicase